jgi:hypothetical protein
MLQFFLYRVFYFSQLVKAFTAHSADFYMTAQRSVRFSA